VTFQSEEEPVKLAFNTPEDDSSIELTTVVAVEGVLRKVRVFARFAVGNRAEADELVEDALVLYLSTDPDPAAANQAFGVLVANVRRMLRRPEARVRRDGDLDPALAPVGALPLDVREIAGLHLGVGLPVADLQRHAELPAAEVLAALIAVREAIGPEAYDRLAPAS
jgi:DNA-directed RNA polymerase specialized sigma24 family protein